MWHGEGRRRERKAVNEGGHVARRTLLPAMDLGVAPTCGRRGPYLRRRRTKGAAEVIPSYLFSPGSLLPLPQIPFARAFFQWWLRWVDQRGGRLAVALLQGPRKDALHASSLLYLLKLGTKLHISNLDTGVTVMSRYHPFSCCLAFTEQVSPIVLLELT